MSAQTARSAAGEGQTAPRRSPRPYQPIGRRYDGNGLPLPVSAAVEVAVKWCGHCRQVKPLSEFSRNRSRADGRAHECKTCARMRITAYNAAKRAEMADDTQEAKHRTTIRKRDVRP